MDKDKTNTTRIANQADTLPGLFMVPNYFEVPKGSLPNAAPKETATEVEVAECKRCKKFIPYQAIFDFDNNKTEDKVLVCPVGRTGRGGKFGHHLFTIKQNMTLKTKMISKEKAEKYPSE